MVVRLPKTARKTRIFPNKTQTLFQVTKRVASPAALAVITVAHPVSRRRREGTPHTNRYRRFQHPKTSRQRYEMLRFVVFAPFFALRASHPKRSRRAIAEHKIAAFHLQRSTRSRRVNARPTVRRSSGSRPRGLRRRRRRRFGRSFSLGAKIIPNFNPGFDSSSNPREAPTIVQNPAPSLIVLPSL